MLTRIFNRNRTDEGSEWLSISDMMTGLMVIFLFIAISYMIQVKATSEKMYDVARTYSETQEELYIALNEEFKKDLENWNADIDDETLSVIFKEPDVLFNTGSAEIKPAFKAILNSFFPRYIEILQSGEFIEYIEEIRIEGHTSSVWENETSDNAYFKNMELSQERTRAVLEYCFNVNNSQINTNKTRNWLKTKITANGLSSSKLIFKEVTDNKMENIVEDEERSRRVEFRVRTNAERQIHEIIGKNNSET